MKKKKKCQIGKKRKKPCILKEYDYQTGKSDKALDKMKLALPSGKRLSKKGLCTFKKPLFVQKEQLHIY